jgi:ferric-dicitrate binding protein FerR (iron transport regulator)
MKATSRSAICERAHVWASLLPDGELSLFERRLLDAHCLRCPECRRLRDDVGSVTAIVRATPLQEMARPVRVSGRRLRPWRPAAGVLASGGAAALAFVLAVWIGPQAHGVHTTTRFVSGPTIVLVPGRTVAENQAIWTFKRERGTEPGAVTGHHTGAVLS